MGPYRKSRIEPIVEPRVARGRATRPRCRALAQRFVVGAAVAAAVCTGGPVEAAHEDGRVLIFAPPFVGADAIWMALTQKFFREEKLAVTVKWVASGRDALRAFDDGQNGKQRPGFVVVNEILALNFWQGGDRDFTVIAPLARDAEAYVVVAKAEVTSAEGLKTKRIATTLGSTSAWFLGEFLRAHGLGERDIAVKDEPPSAILGWDPDQSDIAAFFVREPQATLAGQKYGDKVRRLTTATGYAHGYLLLGTSKRYAREHPGVAERILRALDRGRRHAADHRDEVIAFAREMFGKDTTSVEADYRSMERLIGIDRVTLDDFRKLGRWMKEAGLLEATVEPTALFDPEPLRATFPERIVDDAGRWSQ